MNEKTRGLVVIAGALITTVAAAADVTYLTDVQLRQAINEAPQFPDASSGMRALGLPANAEPTVYGLKRTKAGAAEVHRDFDDAWYVLEGAGTLVTGGSLESSTEASPGELRSAAVTKGESRHLQKGDFIYIPAGVPHWVSAVEGEELVYLVVKVPAKH